jgi:hypothetical protein
MSVARQNDRGGRRPLWTERDAGVSSRFVVFSFLFSFVIHDPFITSNLQTFMVQLQWRI